MTTLATKVMVCPRSEPVIRQQPGSEKRSAEGTNPVGA
jgi:hypothetical protein